MASAQIAPTTVIRITNQEPNNENASILVGQEIEFHNEDNVDYELPLTDQDSGSELPLSLILPAGAKVYFVGAQPTTIQYFVNTAPTLKGRGAGPMTGPYTIGIGSNEPGGGKK